MTPEHFARHLKETHGVKITVGEDYGIYDAGCAVCMNHKHSCALAEIQSLNLQLTALDKERLTLVADLANMTKAAEHYNTALQLSKQLTAEKESQLAELTEQLAQRDERIRQVETAATLHKKFDEQRIREVEEIITNTEL